VLGLPVVAAFFATEYVAERTINWMGWLVTAVVMLIAAPLVIALLSPLAWSMSALVSSARRRGIPAAYRQKGRNWEPQKYVYGGAVAAVVLGVLYGGTVSLGWLPPLSQASTLTAQWISERAQTLPKVRSWFAPQTVPAKYDQPPSNLPALPEEPTVRNAE
jgi:hypothetical protein